MNLGTRAATLKDDSIKFQKFLDQYIYTDSYVFEVLNVQMNEIFFF